MRESVKISLTGSTPVPTALHLDFFSEYNVANMDAAQSTLNNNEPRPQEVVIRRESERDLVVWKAPARFFKKRDKQFFVTVFAVAGIVSLVIFLAEGLMPVILIVSLVFLYYILSTVAPEDIEYKITTKGLKIADKLINWQSIARFWLGKNGETEILYFDTYLIPGRIELVIKPEIKEVLKNEISAYVPYETAPAGGMDKLTNWVSQKLPGNK